MRAIHTYVGCTKAPTNSGSEVQYKEIIIINDEQYQ